MTWAKFSFAWVFLTFILCGPPQEIFAVTLADLDSLQDEVESFGDFVANSDLRKRYLQAFQAYTGSTVPEFQKLGQDIIEMMSKMAGADPEIASALWSKVARGPSFSMSMNPAPVFQVDGLRWSEFLFAASERIDVGSGQWNQWWKSQQQSSRFVTAVRGAESEIAQTLHHTRRRDSRSTLESLILKHKPLIYALLQFQMERPESQNALHSGDWNAISELTHRLATRTGLAWDEFFASTPQLTQYWKTLEPKLLRVERDRYLYGEDRVIETGSRHIHFRATRAFHALFRGICLKICVGGDAKHANWLSARFLAVPLLPNAWVQFVEENGVAGGYVQGVYVEHPTEGVVLNPEFMAIQLKESFGAHSPKIGNGPVTVLDLWLREMQKHLIAGAKGVAISESDENNHAGVQKGVRNLEAYKLGQHLGLASHFHVYQGGDMAYRICRQSWLYEDEHKYQNCLIFDASNSDAKTMRLLNPDVTGSSLLTDTVLAELWEQPGVDRQQILRHSSRWFQIGLAQFRPEQFVAALVSAGVSVKLAEGYVQFLATGKSNPEALQLANTSVNFIRLGLGARGSREALHGISDLTGLPAAFLEYLDSVPASYRKRRVEKYLNAVITTETPSWREVQTFLHALNESGLSMFSNLLVDIQIQYLERIKVPVPIDYHVFRFIFSDLKPNAAVVLIRRTLSTLEHALHVLTVLKIYEGLSYSQKQKMDQLIFDYVTQFLSLSPTPDEVAGLVRLSSLENRVRLRELLMSQNLSLAHKLRLLSAEFSDDRDRVFTENWRSILAESNSVEEVFRLLRSQQSIDRCMKIRLAWIHRIQTAESFLRLFESEIDNATKAYTDALNLEALNQIDVFLSTKPGPLEVFRYVHKFVDGRGAEARKAKLLIKAYMRRFPGGYFGQRLKHAPQPNPSACLQILELIPY